MLFMDSIISMLLNRTRVKSQDGSVFSSEDFGGSSVQGHIFEGIVINGHRDGGIVIKYSIIGNILSSHDGSLMVIGNQIFEVLLFKTSEM